MNLHGYKQKKKNITILLKDEMAKKEKDRSNEKILRLRKAKRNCKRMIDKITPFERKHIPSGKNGKTITVFVKTTPNRQFRKKRK